MRNDDRINRRNFFKQGAIAGATIIGSGMPGAARQLFAQSAEAIPDLVAVRNGEPAAMFDEGIKALGGMTKFISKGQTVVVKPNIGWNREASTGANTNPVLVKRIVEHCLNAGASKVYVFDNSVEKNSYQTSGIEQAAKDGGAKVVPANTESYFEEVRIAGANVLKKTKVHELILESDVFINVPILKHHGSSGLTLAMKNLMGVVWDRREYHISGLHDCIADFCLYRKPDLNIVDAYYVTVANGPQRARPEDVVLKKNLLITKDIVAADAAAAKIFGEKPENILHIKLGHEKKIGNMNLDELNIKKIAL